MTAIEDRPTIGERYCGAIESSNLRLGERRGDVDLIIAAGLVQNRLALALYRLSVEYDAVRAEHQAAERQMVAAAEHARQQRGEGATERAQAITQDAQGAALTAHVLILSQLRSLSEAKELLGRFAVIEATKRRYMRDDRAVMLVAGRVLDYYMAPNCRACDGRGFLGATHRGEKQTICRPCRGAGHRRESIGKDDIERGFANHLLMQISSMLHQAERDIKTGLDVVRDAKKRIAEAE